MTRTQQDSPASLPTPLSGASALVLRAGRSPVVLALLLGLFGAIRLPVAEETPHYTWVEQSCAPAYDCRFAYVPLKHRSDFVLAIDHQPNGDHYRLTVGRTGLELEAVTNGEVTQLGRARGYRPRSFTQEMEVVVKRRPGTIAVVQGPEIVLSVVADQFAEGSLGYLGTLGDESQPEVRYQPVAEVHFADDFMRAASDSSAWQQRSGRWVMNSVSRLGSKPTMSSNPFCVVNRAKDRSLLTAGDWFWDDYAASASARAEGDGWLGIAAYCRSESNYLLFRWSSSRQVGGGLKQLVAVTDGREWVLAAAAGGYQSEQWYRLAIKATDAYVGGYIDDREVLRARNDSFGGGPMGLFTEGLDLAYFDDVVAQSCRDVYDDFDRPGGLKWTTVGGAWRCDRGRFLSAPCRDDAPAMVVAGERDWRDYAATATFTAEGTGAVGLAVNVQSPEDYLLLQASEAAGGGARTAISLVVVEAGKRQVRSQHVVEGALSGSHSLKLTTDNGYLAGEWDGRRVVEAIDFSCRPGKVALLHAQKSPVLFEDLGVEFVGEAETVEQPAVAESMVTDNLMVDWSSPQGAWRRPDPGSGGVRWHRGTFFDDAVLKLPLTQARTRQLEIILAGEKGRADQGYHVLLDGAGSCTLSKLGKQLGSAVLPADGDSLWIGLRGTVVTVTVEGTAPLLHYLDDTPPSGHLLGLASGSAGVDFASLEVSSRNMLDYVFTRAPVDWYVQRGLWGTTTRWNCKKDWSFFGAHKYADYCVPTIWSKQAFRGDLVLEMYAGLPMDTSPNPGYTDPSNLNCTLFGNGRDLSSGYSFIYAGWHNTRSALFRQAQEVGASTRHHFVNPISSNPAFHRHWFYIRAEKIGNRLTYSVDDSPVAEYVDPDPLTAGRVALWSFNNGLMVARARIWFQEKTEGSRFPEPLDRPKARPRTLSVRSGLSCTFERDLGTFDTTGLPADAALLERDSSTSAKGRYSLKATNSTSGGSFAFWAANTELNLNEAPYLSFDYRFPPEAKVNLYLKIDKRYYALVLTGEEQSETVARVIDRIPDFTADGQWHHAEFDLLGAIKTAYGGRVPGDVQSVSFATPRGSYLWCGFGGNPWGTTLNLDNFYLGGYPKGAAAGS